MMNPPAPRSRPRRSTDFDLILRARATLDDALRRQAGFGRRRPGVALAAMAPEPDCDVNGDRVDCDHPDPGVPSVSFPKPQGWPQEISRSASGARYHDYNHRFDYGQGGDATANQGETEARFNPTPGEHDRPATPQGTPNDAGWIARQTTNPVVTYALPIEGQSGREAVVNVTQPGHELHPGYIVQYFVTDPVTGEVRYHVAGEGASAEQSNWNRPARWIEWLTWRNQANELRRGKRER